MHKEEFSYMYKNYLILILLIIFLLPLNEFAICDKVGYKVIGNFYLEDGDQVTIKLQLKDAYPDSVFVYMMSGRDFNGWIKDSDNINVYSKTCYNGDNLFNFMIPSSNTYYFLIYPYNPSQVASYNLLNNSGDNNSNGSQIINNPKEVPITNITKEKNKPPISNPGNSITAYVNEPIYFDGSNSYDPDGNIRSYIWDFGDGTTSYGMTVYHQYSNQGEYGAYLTVVDSGGLKNTKRITIRIEKNTINPTLPILAFIFVLVAIGAAYKKINISNSMGDFNSSTKKTKVKSKQSPSLEIPSIDSGNTINNLASTVLPKKKNIQKKDSKVKITKKTKVKSKQSPSLEIPSIKSKNEFTNLSLEELLKMVEIDKQNITIEQINKKREYYLEMWESDKFPDNTKSRKKAEEKYNYYKEIFDELIDRFSKEQI